MLHGVQNEFGPITVHNVHRSVEGAKSERRGHPIHQQSRCYLQTAPLRSRICILTLYPTRKIEREVESRFINVCRLEEGGDHERQFIDTTDGSTFYVFRGDALCTCVTKALHVQSETIRDYKLEINFAQGVASTIVVSNTVHYGGVRP